MKLGRYLAVCLINPRSAFQTHRNWYIKDMQAIMRSSVPGYVGYPTLSLSLSRGIDDNGSTGSQGRYARPWTRTSSGARPLHPLEAGIECATLDLLPWQRLIKFNIMCGAGRAVSSSAEATRRGRRSREIADSATRWMPKVINYVKSEGDWQCGSS